MNFNFKEILELFSGHWKFLALLTLVGALVGAFVIVPIAQSYFSSDNHSCSKCLDENRKLVDRVLEISALLREYTEVKEVQERMNESVSQMVIESVIEKDTINAPIQVVDDANIKLNKQKDLLIERVKELTELDTDIN